LIREELPDTALFGLRFRQNAARALLMPRPEPGKRAPLWLQRLRAKDLLQVARRFPDFPIVLETFRECLDDDLDLPRLRAFLDAIQAGSVRVARRRGDVPAPLTSEMIFAFTAAHIYEWDGPKRTDRRPSAAVVDEDLLGPLLRGGEVALSDWLGAQAIGRVDNRLRQLGRPPRTAEEMAEHLRRLGDLSTPELVGPMAAFLAELRQAGRAVSIEIAGAVEPHRWVLTEDVALYRTAFHEPRTGPDVDDARESIVERFLRTHALIGLNELTARYPIPPADATELLERWAEQGKAVRLDGDGDGNGDGDGDGPAGSSGPRWADPNNLADVRRATVAAQRRESLAVAPEVFADFLPRWQNVHPSTRGEGPAFVETVLRQLQGHAMPARLWESEILPRRVAGYRPAWLDEVLDRGDWLWRVDASGNGSGDRAEGPRHEPRVAFFRRDFPGQPQGDEKPGGLLDDESRVLEVLERLGASFATDLARSAGIEPSRVRRALAGLTARGLATNDRFDPMRLGAESALLALTEAASNRRGGRSSPARARRSIAGQAEGRWSRLTSSTDGPAARLLAWAEVLLERYGVLTREMTALDRSAPAWAALAPILARAEWRGELRRGYFVEGLSGVQYATEKAATELARLAAQPPRDSPVVMISTVDPANLYGAGAPLDIALLDGGVARLPRGPGNFLAIRDGRPVLIVESHGKRLTGLPSASPADIQSALKHLTGLTGPGRRALKIELYNGMPAAEGPAAGWLADVGFVRDCPGMAYYAGWPTAPSAPIARLGLDRGGREGAKPP
jgi:ATP-dependent Lhr-like helicase